MSHPGPGLTRKAAFINAKRCDASDASTFDVADPSDGSLIAKVANCRREKNAEEDVAMRRIIRDLPTAAE